MVKTVKLCRGLDIRLKGRPGNVSLGTAQGGVYALTPSSFPGLTAKVVVKEGERVRAGDFLFVDKRYPDVGFASPVSGKVKEVVRGERRKLIAVVVEADEEQEYADFGRKNANEMNGKEVVQHITCAGLLGFFRQLPYAISANDSALPRDIFVSALRDMPLASDFEEELKGNEHDFQTGLTALSRIAKVHLGIGRLQSSAALLEARDAEVTVYDGRCPAGNVGVQVNHAAPVGKNEIVWTVDPMVVVFVGRLFNTGRVDLRRRIAVAGEKAKKTGYVDAVVGVRVGDVLTGLLNENDYFAGRLRIIDGNVLTGRKTTLEDFVSAITSEVTVIDEGADNDEMIGWILPRLGQFSSHHSYFSWLLSKKREYSADARIKGGKRNIIMSGEYDKVLPMDIYGEYLIKAILAEDIDRMEQLGIYEVSPEDFAVAEFVDSSKQPLQQIVRKGLDMIRKENE